MNILIVEDDYPSAKILKKQTESLEHTATITPTGKEALQKIKEVSFDLVMLDIFLPDYNGADLIPQFKIIQPSMGIIAMTGHNSRDLELQIRALGIYYYLIKPFKKQILKTILDHISTTKDVSKSE